jgi:hypothetical protein
MKSKVKFAIIGISIILVIIIIIVVGNSKYKVSLMNNSSNMNLTIKPIPSVNIEPNNTTLTFPSNDYTINHINWYVYPNLNTGYIYTVYAAGPNDVLSYEFIEVQICTEIKNTEDRAIIEDQLAGVAREAKKIYGPDSSINIIGTKGGIARWFASILPFNDTVRF